MSKKQKTKKEDFEKQMFEKYNVPDETLRLRSGHKLSLYGVLEDLEILPDFGDLTNNTNAASYKIVLTEEDFKKCVDLLTQYYKKQYEEQFKEEFPKEDPMKDVQEKTRFFYAVDNLKY